MPNTANASHVSVGKPKVAGAIYRAPAGTALPTDATTTLAEAFETLGYISEDGLKNKNTNSSVDIKDWSGVTVQTVADEHEDEFTFTMLEVLNVLVLKTVFGSNNVYGTLETGIKIRANSSEPEEAVYVAEILMNTGAIKRIVIPRGKISEIGEVTYKRNEAIGYAATLKALANADGDTHIEYIGTPATDTDDTDTE